MNLSQLNMLLTGSFLNQNKSTQTDQTEMGGAVRARSRGSQGFRLRRERSRSPKRKFQKMKVPGHEDGKGFARRHERSRSPTHPRHPKGSLGARAQQFHVEVHRDKKRKWDSDAALEKEGRSVFDFVNKRSRRRGRSAGIRPPKRARIAPPGRRNES